MEGNANASLGKFTLLVQISTYVGTADATEEKLTPFVQMWKVPLIPLYANFAPDNKL